MPRSVEEVGVEILLKLCRDFRAIGVDTINISEVEEFLLPREEDPSAPEFDEAALVQAAADLLWKMKRQPWDRLTESEKSTWKRRATFVLRGYFDKLLEDRYHG